MDKNTICTPVNEAEMRYVGSRLTLCELIRQIYNSTDDQEIKLRCRVAVSLSKVMEDKLEMHVGKSWGRKHYAWNPEKRCERERAKWDAIWKERGEI